MRRRIRKVMLINPPRVIYRGRERKRTDFPLGMGYLGAMLKLEGFEVLGLDSLLEGLDTEEDLENGKFRFGMRDAEIKQRIAEFAPDVVGVSNLFTDGAMMAYHVCKLAKEVDKDIITLIGGHHPSSAPMHALRHGKGFIDYVILGEGDFSTGMLLRCLSRGTSLKRFPGIAYWDSEGSPVINPFIEPIHNVDLLPWPDRTLFPIYKYAEVGCPHGDEIAASPYTPIMTSRGCTARCIFCAAFNVHGREFRPRDPENVLDEMEYLVKEMGFRELHIEDDNLTHNRRRAMKIFQGMIDRELNIAWTPSNGIALYNMDREMIKAMKDSGCYAIWLPVESGDPVTLRRIKKPMPYKRVGELVKIMKEYGIKTKGFFMYGFPGETAEQIENTAKFAKSLELDYATFFLATPLPSTELWDMAAEINPALNDPDFDVENLKYARSNISTGGLSYEELERIRKKIWLRVNWDLDENEEPPPGM